VVGADTTGTDEADADGVWRGHDCSLLDPD